MQVGEERREIRVAWVVVTNIIAHDVRLAEVGQHRVELAAGDVALAAAGQVGGR